jgi:hypothetical protein
VPAMDVVSNVILPHLLGLCWTFLIVLCLWAVYAFIQARRKDKVRLRLPVKQSLTFLLVITACIIVAASLLAGGGHLVGLLFSNPGDQFTLAGAMIGSVTGAAIGWELQRRSTL